MRTKHVAAVAAVAFGLPTLAAANSADTDGDGVLTIEEVQAVAPTIDAETFSVMDANGDGTLDQGEIQVAEEAGILPPSNG